MADRDNRTKMTPPAGVAAQLAGPERWDEHTDQYPTPVGEHTVDESVVARIDRRGGETKNLTINTLSGIEALRRETHDKFDKVHHKIDEQGKILSDVRVTTGAAVAQNEIIIKMLDDQRTAKAQSGEIRVVRETVTAEVHGAREKSQIEIDKEKELADFAVHKAKRSAVVEAVKEIGVNGVIAIGGLLGGAIAAGIGIERCGG